MDTSRPAVRPSLYVACLLFAVGLNLFFLTDVDIPHWQLVFGLPAIAVFGVVVGVQWRGLRPGQYLFTGALLGALSCIGFLVSLFVLSQDFLRTYGVLQALVNVVVRLGFCGALLFGGSAILAEMLVRKQYSTSKVVGGVVSLLAAVTGLVTALKS